MRVQTSERLIERIGTPVRGEDVARSALETAVSSIKLNLPFRLDGKVTVKLEVEVSGDGDVAIATSQIAAAQRSAVARGTGSRAKWATTRENGKYVITRDGHVVAIASEESDAISQIRSAGREAGFPVWESHLKRSEWWPF